LLPFFLDIRGTFNFNWRYLDYFGIYYMAVLDSYSAAAKFELIEEKNGLSIISILGTCEIKISKYDYVIYKPISKWKMVKNRVTKKRYLRAKGAGLRLIGRRIGLVNDVQIIQFKEIFDERVRSEKQEYTELLRREAKGRTDITLDLGYIHGRPLKVTLDESQLYRNFRPIYQ
ncbi:19353_t:CDS:2, partial [Gigaspora rosea]